MGRLGVRGERRGVARPVDGVAAVDAVRSGGQSANLAR